MVSGELSCRTPKGDDHRPCPHHAEHTAPAGAVHKMQGQVHAERQTVPVLPCSKPPTDRGSEESQIAQWVSKNETGIKSYQVFNPNDHGNGISVGLMQWNQKKGRLPELLQSWHHKDPAKFNRIFGASASALLRTDWVRHADFVGNRNLFNSMHTALQDSEFQQVQWQLRHDQIQSSCQLAERYHFTSLRGRAVVADVVNQCGAGAAERALQRLHQKQPESARIEELKSLTGRRMHGGDRVFAIEEQVKAKWRQIACANSINGSSNGSSNGPRNGSSDGSSNGPRNGPRNGSNK